MNILLLGGAGFIGTNLAIELSRDPENVITIADRQIDHLKEISALDLKGIHTQVAQFDVNTDFDSLLEGQDVVYHLVSTTVPTTSNRSIPQEFSANVDATAALLEACIRSHISKLVFLSSGGTVYGKESDCPLKETAPTYPISSYGIQKITIEKLIYLYHYLYGLDYRIIRLANPYGPYQRPNGIQGAVTTFTYKALKDEEIRVYGDGSVIRDFIYIDDAVRGILNIVNGESAERTFNLGCGRGTSIRQVLDCIEETLQKKLQITWLESRSVDVPVNYLDISRYEEAYGKLQPISLAEGIRKTADFMKGYYGL